MFYPAGGAQNRPAGLEVCKNTDLGDANMRFLSERTCTFLWFSGYNEIMQTMLHILELEMATLCSMEMTKALSLLREDAFSQETRGETEAVAMLCTACNMLASKQHAVVKALETERSRAKEVFLSWWPGRPSFWMRIMQKIMQIFGHTKKVPRDNYSSTYNYMSYLRYIYMFI